MGRSTATVAEWVCDPDELARRVQSGDIDVLADMTHCFGHHLLSVGRRLCRDDHLAQDVVQDALLSAGVNLTTFRGDGRLESWLTRMVANACWRMHRGRKNDASLHVTEVDIATFQADPELRAEQAELGDLLGEALLELQPRDRVIVMLSDVEGYKANQIADKLGMTHGSVRTRLSRARKQLRAVLEARGISGSVSA
jgi:RNA polymerase sigma-70 factor (ECF subfamily)